MFFPAFNVSHFYQYWEYVSGRVPVKFSTLGHTYTAGFIFTSASVSRIQALWMSKLFSKKPKIPERIYTPVCSSAHTLTYTHTHRHLSSEIIQSLILLPKKDWKYCLMLRNSGCQRLGEREEEKESNYWPTSWCGAWSAILTFGFMVMCSLYCCQQDIAPDSLAIRCL